MVHVLDYCGGDGSLAVASVWFGIKATIFVLNDEHKDFILRLVDRAVVEFMKDPQWPQYGKYSSEEILELMKSAFPHVKRDESEDGDMSVPGDSGN